MYIITCTTDGEEYTIYNPIDDEAKLIDPKLSLELNKTGTLTFSVPITNPNIEKIKKMESEITVYDDEEIIFIGRPLSDETDFYNTGTIPCEGVLAYLVDSIVRPYTHQGSIKDFFNQLIKNHNNQVDERKKFKIGTVNVVDNNNYINRSSTGYSNTLEVINEKLIDTHGGYLRLRFEKDGRYIDYISDYGNINAQTIEFGQNLIDLNKFIKSDDLITALIPLGAEVSTGEGEDKKRITIEPVNDGIDYVYDDEAVAHFGWIYGIVEWKDVTEPSNLKKKAEEYLKEHKNLLQSLELTAVDMSKLDVDTERIKVGDWIRAISIPHKMDELYLVPKVEINIADPAKNKISLGSVQKSFTFDSVKNNNSITTQLKEGLSGLEQNFLDDIEHATQLITGGMGGYVVLDPPGKIPERILVMDKPTKDEAKSVIQINKNGIGFSTEGINGPYKNAWTIDGRLIADFVTAGKIKAGTVGGWNVTDDAVYTESSVDGQTYRSRLQKAIDTDAYTFSTSQKNSSGGYTVIAGIRADGFFLCNRIRIRGKLTADGDDVSIFKAGLTCGDTNAYANVALSVMGSGVVKNDLDVLGTLRAEKGYINSSDRKLKDKINPLEEHDAVDFIMSLKPMEFVFKDEPEKIRHGFIAQDVKEAMKNRKWGVYEEIEKKQPVDEKDSELKIEIVAAVRYDEIISDLVKVVQVQKKRIDDLEVLLNERK